MFIFRTTFLALLLFFSCFNGKIYSSQFNDYESNPYVLEEERELVSPYLMPDDHPLKKSLDAIFYASRVTLNSFFFKLAGFNTKFSQPRSFIIVASHPNLNGYLLKLHLDTEKREKQGHPGWYWFVQRIIGANKIRDIIEREQSKYFTVPHKWIYPLPIEPDVPNDPTYLRKNELLVVEDMHLVSKIENLRAWKKVTKEVLDEFYSIISQAGGASYRAQNVCYTKQGKFAFIDTEYPDKPTKYSSIRRFLTKDMAAYWDQLTRN